jgi:hypothetical protein
MDKFFEAKNRFNQMGPLSYLDDINQTYNKLPQRSSATFERALQFRQKEKAQINALAEENMLMRQKLQHFDSLAREARDALRSQSEDIFALNSKLQEAQKNGITSDRSSNSSGNDGVPSVQKPNDGSIGGASPNMQSEVLSADVPDTSGHGAQHSDAGRPIADDGLTEQPISSGVPSE